VKCLDPRAYKVKGLTKIRNKKKTCTLRLKREKGPTKHNVDELKIFYSKE